MRDILEDRVAVNILKLIHDREVVDKHSYFTSLDDIRRNIVLRANFKKSLELLSHAGLVDMDMAQGTTIVCITEKGKVFINHFDQLIALVRSGPKDISAEKHFRIEYDLSPVEKRMLVICYKMQNENGALPISLGSLAQELYPYGSPESKRSSISRSISRLAGLNLCEKIRQGRTVAMRLTESGMNLIRNENAPSSPRPMIL